MDIFFVISGFIIWLTGAHLTPGAFAARRLIRIVPIYWLTTLVVGLVSFDHGIRIGLEAPLGHLLGSLLFLPLPELSGDHGYTYPLIYLG